MHKNEAPNAYMVSEMKPYTIRQYDIYCGKKFDHFVQLHDISIPVPPDKLNRVRLGSI